MTLLSSLTNRIFLATAALAVLSMGVAIAVVNVAVTRQAEDELRRGLEEADALVEHYRSLLFEHFTREARLIADLPRLKAAVAEDDPPTVQPIAEEYNREISADLFLVTNARGRVLALVGSSEFGAEQMTRLPAVQSALRGRQAASFWPGAAGVLQMVSVPIWINPSQPELLGTLSVGFSLDERIAQRLKQLSESEITFASDGRIVASTLRASELTPLLDRLAPGAIQEVTVADEDYVAIARPLAPGGADAGAPATDPARSADLAAGGSGRPVALILRSRTEQLRFLRALQTVLAGTALVALLAATLLSYAVARTVTRPLGAITATMREMAATGDLTRRIELPRGAYWDDEDARLLATTFNTMTESIARFQREMSQRERLSSLGRLSTVVAHEIRNPLMIIKTSLRTLRRDEATPAEIRAAVTDINEEVARLNRLVGEVLDFARPIRFTLAPADLNRLCRDAAAATAAGDDGPTIALALAPEAADVVTDAERVRLALVNILTNARDAVAARAGQPADDRAPQQPDVAETAGRDRPQIDLETNAVADHRVAIIVRDRGVGIAPEDLSRVFEPFFTTKRTGSGLGLAIARNIIEGLGGTIAATSRTGEGTEIRIELPRRPEPETAREGHRALEPTR